MSQLAGIWLGIVIIAAWSIVCILLGLLFVGSFERVVIVGLWLLIVAPISWAFRMTRLRR
jgi:hypothetical protein